MDYNILQPCAGYIIVKEVEDANDGKVLIKSREQESRAMGKVIAIPLFPQFDFNGEKLKIGDLVVYNEFEGQELFKHGDIITEDHIIVIKEENIVLKINEQKNVQPNNESVKI